MGARLHLDKRNAKLLGVCAGLAEFTGLDVFWIRVTAIVVTLLGSGLPLLAYIVIALLAPASPNAVTE
jgi:phage shock protein C